MSKVLFEITEEHLDTGLRGIPVGTCTTSKVDPQAGLSYRGYSIIELAKKEPEEVIFLLLNGEIPNENELQNFKSELKSATSLPEEVIHHFRSLPKKAHPMKWFLSGINAMGMVLSEGNYEKDAVKIIANLPIMTASLLRIHSGWGDLIPPKPELGYMENFAHMLGAPHGTNNLPKLLRVFNILHFDHGGGNLSTFVGKAVASGHADIYESLTAAMAGLAGALHGKANEFCLKFLREVLTEIKNPEDEKALNEYLVNLWNKGGKLYGFGHAVLRVEDPRAAVQYTLGDEIAANDPIFKMAKTMRKVGVAFLKTKEKVTNPYPNVDAVSGSLLNACGLTDSNYYTVLFGLSRCVGIAAQIVYDRTKIHDGKGSPIIRPKYIYTGPVRL